MDNLLVPIDYSSVAENALLYAGNLAKKYSTGLDVVHVYPGNQEKEGGEQASHSIEVPAVNSLQVKKLKNYLEDLKARFPKDLAEIEIHEHVLEGDVINEIRTYCDSNPVRIIVMGTKGEGKESKGMGSVTSEIVKTVKSSVLAIPNNAEYRDINKIVYCIDYEGYDKFTLNSLAAFAEKFDAEIIILHINTEPQYFDSSRWANFQSMINDAYEYENLKFEFLNHENVIEAVDEYIAEKDVNLLAMLTRNDHLIDKVYPRSLTRSMVLHTQIPLLAFHE